LDWSACAVEAAPSNRAKRINRGSPSLALRVLRSMRKLSQLHIFRFEHIPRSLPSNGNATTRPINSVQSLVLVVLDNVMCDQHHGNKTERQQPAAIKANNLLKKKIISTTSPMLLLKCRQVHQEMSRIYHI